MPILAVALLAGLNFVSVASLSLPADRRSDIRNEDETTIDSKTALNRTFSVDDPPNLIFIKVPKAASSTTGGVARRIADQKGLACVNDGCCDFKREPGVSACHLRRSKYGNLKLKKPIVWMTSIRDPLSRCMSMFYHFKVGRQGVTASAEDKLRYLKSASCRDYQWKYICTSELCRTGDLKDVATALDAYDFVVVADRFDESMALLINTFGLKLSDALYLEAKDSSNFSSSHPSFEEEPLEVQEFGLSDEFKKQNEFDYTLYNMVNERMNTQMEDLTNKNTYHFYTKLSTKAKTKCMTNCTWDVQRNTGVGCEDCYWHDNGCGYSCFDDTFSGKD